MKRRGVMVDLERVRRALDALDRLIAEHPELKGTVATDRLARYLSDVLAS